MLINCRLFKACMAKWFRQGSGSIYGTIQNVYSKQARGWFLAYLSLINIVCLQCSAIKKCVFKARERLLFSLFIINQYCTPNILLQKICVQSNWEAAF